MKRILPWLWWIIYGVVVGVIQYPQGWWWWGLGFGLAGIIILADRWLYIWWLKPFEQLSIQFQYWWKRREILPAWRLLVERGGEQTKLVLKSLGFAVIWPLITIYIFSSTGSIIAAGIIMALGFRLVLSILADWKNPSVLSRWFCWQIKREMTIKEVKIVAGLFIASWAMVIGLLILK